MNKVFILIAGILVLGLLGFAVLGNKNSQPSTNNTQNISPSVQPTETEPKEITITLDSQNNSRQSGVATLKEENGKVVVSIAVATGAANIAQPAHIHKGACPTPGEVLFPLTNVINGTSETTLDTTLDELTSQLPLALNVHKSASQSSIYVSCGNIE